MLLNFKINSEIHIEFENCYFDLHNDYDLTSFEYKTDGRKFIINWARGIGDWINNSPPLTLSMEFTNTSFLRIKENEKSDFLNYDSCLDVIGLCSLDMRDDMESWLPKNAVEGEFDLLLIFMNGQTIKINSQKVELKTF
jgi:hypothetical protein